MATAKKSRTKSPALTVSVQTRDEAVEAVRRLGDIGREAQRIAHDLNDKVAAMQEAADAAVAPLQEEAAVHAWANANRDTLTDGGKVKFADLTTGIIRWRNNPPSCRVTGQDAVIALMQGDTGKYGRFLRTKTEVNKEAVLNEAAFFEANPPARPENRSGQRVLRYRTAQSGDTVMAKITITVEDAPAGVLFEMTGNLPRDPDASDTDAQRAAVMIAALLQAAQRMTTPPKRLN